MGSQSCPCPDGSAFQNRRRSLSVHHTTPDSSSLVAAYDSSTQIRVLSFADKAQESRESELGEKDCSADALQN